MYTQLENHWKILIHLWCDKDNDVRVYSYIHIWVCLHNIRIAGRMYE